MLSLRPLFKRPGRRRFAPAALTVRVYDNTLVAAAALDASLLGEATRDAWRAEYRAVAATPPLARSDYDLRLAPGALVWLKAPCDAADTAGEFAFAAWPADGGAAVSFACDFGRCGVRVDGACMVSTRLPRRTLKTIVAGQRLRHGPHLWRVAVAMGAAGATAAHALGPLAPGELVARGRFDLHLDGATLTYVKAPCRPEDMSADFFLHAFPADRARLPAHRQENGFHNLDFKMAHYDAGLIARFGGRCVASARLPGHPIARLRTGQFDQHGNPYRNHWTIELKESM